MKQSARASVAAFAAGFMLFASGSAQAFCSGNFTCYNSGGRACWFVITSNGSNMRNFILEPGESRRIYGLRDGDIFCSANNGYPNPFRCYRKQIKMSCGGGY